MAHDEMKVEPNRSQTGSRTADSGSTLSTSSGEMITGAQLEHAEAPSSSIEKRNNIRRILRDGNTPTETIPRSDQTSELPRDAKNYNSIINDEHYVPTALDDIMNAIADKLKALETSALDELGMAPLAPKAVVNKKRKRLSSLDERDIINDLEMDISEREQILADLPTDIDEKIHDRTEEFEELSELERIEIRRKLKQRRALIFQKSPPEE